VRPRSCAGVRSWLSCVRASRVRPVRLSAPGRIWSVGAAGERLALETAGFGMVAGGVGKRPGCLPELPWWELVVVLGGESAAELAAVWGRARRRLGPGSTAWPTRTAGCVRGSPVGWWDHGRGAGAREGRHMLDGGAPVVVVSAGRIAGVKP
jgi:hypothetical protein